MSPFHVLCTRGRLDLIPRPVSLVSGVFDPLHPGHLAYLSHAQHVATAPLLCAVASDGYAQRKHGAALLPEATRATIVHALPQVAHVVVEDDLVALVRAVRPRELIKGTDWTGRLPRAVVDACQEIDTRVCFVETGGRMSSTRQLQTWRQEADRAALSRFERFVQSQPTVQPAWSPVTDYSAEARTAAEGPHADLIVKHLTRGADDLILDYGCGPGHLIRMLRDHGAKVDGYDHQAYPDEPGGITHDVATLVPHAYDLVICREVLEHCPMPTFMKTLAEICSLTRRLLYITTRFAKDPAGLLDADDHDDLDPDHRTLLNQTFLRALIVAHGLTRRADLETLLDHQGQGRVLIYERHAL